jgi:uncharacterized membrane protein YphA (DoxX/SURF4 family)
MVPAASSAQAWKHSLRRRRSNSQVRLYRPDLVHAFLTVLPFAEFILGGLITLGLFTRWALALGGLLIMALIFATALRSDWTTAGIQMIYAITYYLLLLNHADNTFSLDALLRAHRWMTRLISGA